MLMVFGWLVMVVIACYCWFVTIGGSIAELGFTGKLSGATIIPFAVAVGMSYLVVDSFPFELAIKVAQ